MGATVGGIDCDRARAKGKEAAAGGGVVDGVSEEEERNAGERLKEERMQKAPSHS